MDRNVQNVLSMALFTQCPLRHEQCWLLCQGVLSLMAFSSVSSFVSCFSYGSIISVMWQTQIWLLSGFNYTMSFCPIFGIQCHKQIHHLYIHHVKDMSTWFLCLMKLVYSSRKRSGIISLNISIWGYVASQII